MYVKMASKDPPDPDPTPPEIYNEDYENYIVYGRSINEQPIKKFTFLKKIFEMEKQITNIVQINTRTYKIICLNKEVANNLVLQQPLEVIGVKCSIPFINKYTTVIINQVETEISDDDLKLVLEKISKIHSVEN